MPQLPTPIESGFADVNGVKIWYQTYGEGEPLVLIHGGFVSVEMFGPNIEALSEGRKVIGVDLQAHGGTGPLGRPMTFEDIATDVADLIRFLGYEKADVMGYSLGGATALRVAIDHPEVVDRLVVVSTAYARAMGADPEGTAESLNGTPQHQGYITKAPGGEATWVDAVTEFVTFIGQNYDWSAEVPNITAPTLVVIADWDAVRISAATKLFELLGGGAQDANWDRSGMGRNHFAVIPNATHYDIINSTAVSEIATPFLGGYTQTAATPQSSATAAGGWPSYDRPSPRSEIGKNQMLTSGPLRKHHDHHLHLRRLCAPAATVQAALQYPNVSDARAIPNSSAIL